MTRSGNGVEVRDTSIRLAFTDQRGADGGRQKALMEAVFGKQEERKVG